MLFWRKKKNKNIEKDKEIEISVGEDLMVSDDSQDDIKKSANIEIEEVLDTEKLTKKIDDMAKFLTDRGFFVKEFDNPTEKNSKFKWKIGPLGVLIRQNVLRWWWSEVNHKLQRQRDIFYFQEHNF